MTDPDDDWAELARELERDQPPPSEDDATSDESDEGDELPDAIPEHDADDTEVLDLETGDAEAEGDADDGESTPGEGQPGTGRKRRRRRRRRKKGGQSTDAAAEADTAAESESEPETEPEAIEDSDSDDEDERVPVSAADDGEDAAGELLRDLIANWNVPSWDEIICGLHRP